MAATAYFWARFSTSAGLPWIATTKGPDLTDDGQSLPLAN